MFKGFQRRDDVADPLFCSLPARVLDTKDDATAALQFRGSEGPEAPRSPNLDLSLLLGPDPHLHPSGTMATKMPSRMPKYRA